MTDGILVITTGGTIGALPYPDSSKPPLTIVVPEDGRDFVTETLKGPQFAFATLRCVSFKPKDSKNIDDIFRQEIINTIVGAPEREIIVTHGTDRILQTANYFFRQRENISAFASKVVILTGAMVALANGPQSDGYLNLEFSLREAGKLQPGIYVVLCDYEHPDNERGTWKPRLYSHKPGVYQKMFGDDARYNRLRPIAKR